jgi:hypothetical protein
VTTVTPIVDCADDNAKHLYATPSPLVWTTRGEGIPVVVADKGGVVKAGFSNGNPFSVNLGQDSAGGGGTEQGGAEGGAGAGAVGGRGGPARALQEAAIPSRHRGGEERPPCDLLAIQESIICDKNVRMTGSLGPSCECGADASVFFCPASPSRSAWGGCCPSLETLAWAWH